MHPKLVEHNNEFRKPSKHGLAGLDEAIIHQRDDACEMGLHHEHTVGARSGNIRKASTRGVN